MTMHPVPTVALALNFPKWEAEFLSAANHPASAVRVARRCVDATDVLAYVLTVDVDAVLVAVDLPGLDAHTVSVLAQSCATVIGVASDLQAYDRAFSLGISHCVLVEPGHAIRAVQAVATTLRDSQLRATDVNTMEIPASPAGTVVVVAGPTGSVGRTMAAVTIADESVRRGRRCLLIDADVRAGSVDQMLGITDCTASVDWLLHQISLGQVQATTVWDSAFEVGENLRVIAGPSGSRLLRPQLWKALMGFAAETADLVVIDAGALPNPQSSFDPDPADAAFATLSAADVALMMGGSDPIAVARLLRCLHEVRQVVPAERICTVVSRERADDQQWHEFMERRLAHRIDDHVVAPRFIAEDASACSKALKQAVTLAEAAPRSRARRDLQALAEHLWEAAKAA